MNNLQAVEKLRLIDKEIDLSESPVLFNEVINQENIKDIFDIYNSQWTVVEGWFTGKNHDESAGMAILKKNFPGNVLIEFSCRTIPPSSHDINFMWNGEWSDALNSCNNAYIGSICGWHCGRIGIEKSPEYKFRVTVPNNEFEPGRTYKVQAGSLNGTCFIFIDGSLAIEADDPNPLDNIRYTKIAFTAWSSHIQIKDILIRQIKWEPMEISYQPEF